MSMSPELQQAIASAHVKMIAHPERILIPIDRRAIYNLLNGSDPLHEQQVFKWLAVITARSALSIWQKDQPDDESPEYLINIAEGIMNGAVSAATAEIEASKAWEQIENMASINHDASTNKRSFYAYVAAFEALMEVLGRNPFSDIIFDEQDTDSDLDPWSSDAAHWTAAAYSGQVGDQESDIFKRQKFWQWWLQEAIPVAWSIANK